MIDWDKIRRGYIDFEIIIVFTNIVIIVMFGV